MSGKSTDCSSALYTSTTAPKISRWHILTAVSVYTYMIVDHLIIDGTVEASVDAAETYAWLVTQAVLGSGVMRKSDWTTNSGANRDLLSSIEHLIRVSNTR